MKQLTRKLHSRRGASMVMALLFFLVCTMVASVVIAAASANADRIALRRQEQQAYLALSSAIDYVRSELAAVGDYQGQQVLTEYKCYDLLPATEAGQPREFWTDGSPEAHRGGDATHHNNTVVGDYEVVEPPTEDSPIANAVWEMATLITMAHLPGPTPLEDGNNPRRVVTIAAEGLPEVIVTMEMQDAEAMRYDVKTVMTVAGSDYAVSFDLDASSEDQGITETVEQVPNEEGEYPDYHRVTRYEWSSNGWQAVNITIPTTVKTTTYSYTVSWVMGGLSKGGGGQ